MGCSISCTAFECFSSFVEWKLRTRVGCKSTAHYLDDYLFCGEQNIGKCKFILDTFWAMADEIGLLLAKEKTEGPVSTLTFLGIQLNIVHQTSRVPQEKLEDLKNRIT